MKSVIFRKWIVCLAILLTALLLFFILPMFPAVAEYVFARGIFRIIAFPVEWLMSVFPFSVTELVVLALVPAVLVLLVCWIFRIRRSSSKKKTVERGIRFVAWVLALVALVFMVMDGANFSRYPLTRLLDLPEEGRYTGEQLAAVMADLGKKASGVRLELAEDETGCSVLSESLSDTLLAGPGCYDSLREQYSFLTSGVWRVKAVALSHQWSYTGYTGVYCPWLGEASVNVDVPPCELGHTILHELAHTMGFAKEDECNFLGYLAAVSSGRNDFAYSGYLAAWTYCSNALYRYDKDLWRQVYAQCGAGMRRDIKAKQMYWKQFEGKVMDSSQTVNDAFIKVNGVKSGTLNYGEMVALLMKYYDKQGFFD